MISSPERALPLVGEAPEVVKPDTGDQRLWSVTTINGVMDKPALVHWAAKETAKAALDQERAWRGRLEHEGRDSALKYLADARWRAGKGQRSATELGKAVHAAIEHKEIYGEYDDDARHDAELRPYLVQADRFLDEFQPEIIAAEVTVFSPTWGYAGTADAFQRLQDTPLIVDYKTSREPRDSKGDRKTPYPEVGMQLAAYRYAELAAVWRARQSESYKRRYYLLNDTERALAVPVPEVAGGVAVLITPEFYAVHPVRCGPSIFELFLHLVDVAGFAFEIAATVVGSPMIPPHALERSVAGDPFEGLDA